VGSLLLTTSQKLRTSSHLMRRTMCFLRKIYIHIHTMYPRFLSTSIQVTKACWWRQKKIMW